MKSHGLLLAIAALSGAACSAPTPAPLAPVVEGGQPPPLCTDGNVRPAPPIVTSPLNGARDVPAASVSISADGFADDDDSDRHRATRFEILRQKSNGLKLVWEHESFDPGRLKQAELADGTWLDDGALLDDEDYLVRVLFRDDSSACNDWSLPAEASFHTNDGGDFIFDDQQLLTFELLIPPETIDALNAQALPPGCVQFPREAFRGTLIYGDQVFENVGVRTKGGCGSSRTLDEKASFKVDLAWDDPEVPGCPAERRLFGQKTLTFNNGVQDPSASHERLGYELYRAAGVPAPRVASAQIIVNGEPWGVYSHVETWSRRLLGRFFQNNDGMMYEGAYWCDLIPENVPLADEFSCFAREFEPDACDAPASGEDAQDWELLRALAIDVRGLSDGASFYPEVEAVLDFDEFLTMWAVDATLSHWDAYSFTIINNYRVYHDPATGLWSMFPWGIDQTFNGGDDVDPFGSDAILVNQCIADAECLAAFGQRLGDIAILFESLDLATTAAAIHDQLQPFVYADARKEYSNEEWEAQHDALQAWIADRPTRIREHLAARGF